MLDLHCDRILLDEGNNYQGLLNAIAACNSDDHLYCLPLEQIVSSKDLRETIQRMMRTKSIDITTIV